MNKTPYMLRRQKDHDVAKRLDAALIRFADGPIKLQLSKAAITLSMPRILRKGELLALGLSS